MFIRLSCSHIFLYPVIFLWYWLRFCSRCRRIIDCCDNRFYNGAAPRRLDGLLRLFVPLEWTKEGIGTPPKAECGRRQSAQQSWKCANTNAPALRRPASNSVQQDESRYDKPAGDVPASTSAGAFCRAMGGCACGGAPLTVQRLSGEL